jgi:hypothetical protein
MHSRLATISHRNGQRVLETPAERGHQALLGSQLDC